MLVEEGSLQMRNESTARGFEPLRAEPNGFLVHHLSHSVTLSQVSRIAFIVSEYVQLRRAESDMTCTL